MSPTTLTYNEVKKELLEEIQKHNHGVLATSDGNFVTAREMMILTDGFKMYCFTANHTRKIKQIETNNNVALSINNVQVEGIATLKGHPSDKENAGFMKMFAEKYPQAFEFWRGLLENPDSGFGIIEITPSKLTAYKTVEGNTYLDILNLTTEKATRAYLDDIDYDQY